MLRRGEWARQSEELQVRSGEALRSKSKTEAAVGTGAAKCNPWCVVYVLAAYGLAAIVVSPPIALGGSDRLTGCAEVRDLSPRAYWFWDGYLGFTEVADRAGLREGRLLVDRATCFRIELASLEEPSARTQGYKRAIREWFKLVPLEAQAWISDTAVLLIRRRLEDLTGQPFPRREDWKRWWVENADFLEWSEDAGRLVVVEDAKREGRRITAEIRQIDAVEYWFLHGLDRLKDVREMEGTLRATAWVPPEGDREVRVGASEVLDLAAKQQGYRLALRNLVLDGIAIPGLSERSREELVAKLRRMTDLDLSSSQEWIAWWNENKDNLILSEDSERLVVRTQAN